MSASLFHDCIAPYKGYPKTLFIKGATSFGELKNGDVLYCLTDLCRGIDELIVTNKWHRHNGHYYISTQFKVIDFGESNCWNVEVQSKRNSIVFYGGCVIGTDKESVIKTKMEMLKDHLAEAEAQKKRIEAQIENLKFL